MSTACQDERSCMSIAIPLAEGLKYDGFAKSGKIPALSFRAQREISGIIERFLVALLLEMTDTLCSSK